MSSAAVTYNTNMDVLPMAVSGDVSYATFKQALITLHEQGKEGAQEGDFQVLNRGLKLLNELSVLFPNYARQLADDPEFLS